MSVPFAEVIGDPIAQSKSPLIHRFWLQALGLDGDYRAQQVTEAQLPAYLAERAVDPAWRGCNVTMPLKEAVLKHVADPGNVRDSIGAANTVFRGEGGALAATNTDAAGFWAPLAELDLAGQPVVVVGAGGAARAVLFALDRVGAGSVTVLNRNVLKAAALLARFGLKGNALPLAAPLPPAALIVNASALGMTGQPSLALDLASQPEDCIVYDLVYSPLETGLLAAARARDLDTIDGLEMLIGQAAVAFELFFGAEPPRERDDEIARIADGMSQVTLGLTGSIGMGKSTVAAMFADLGVPVFDADATVHWLQGKGGRLVGVIEAAFPGTTGPAGVNRVALGEAVLGKPDLLSRLEAIVHPAVGEERAAFLKRHAAAPLVVFDVPLLFETGGESRVDRVAVVSAPTDVQRMRVLARPGMTQARLDAILARQTPDAEKRARADYVIDTGGSMDATRARVAEIVADLA